MYTLSMFFNLANNSGKWACIRHFHVKRFPPTSVDDGLGLGDNMSGILRMMA